MLLPHYKYYSSGYFITTYSLRSSCSSHDRGLLLSSWYMLLIKGTMVYIQSMAWGYRQCCALYISLDVFASGHISPMYIMCAWARLVSDTQLPYSSLFCHFNKYTPWTLACHFNKLNGAWHCCFNKYAQWSGETLRLYCSTLRAISLPQILWTRCIVFTH